MDSYRAFPKTLLKTVVIAKIGTYQSGLQIILASVWCDKT